MGIFGRIFKWKSYLEMSPAEKCRVVIQFTSLVYRVFGLNFMDANYKLTPRILIVIYLQASFAGLLAYTVYYYRDTPFEIIKVTTTMAIFFPTCDRMAKKLLTSSINTSLFIVFSLVLTILIPVYKTMYLNQNRLILLILLPFTDIETEDGFMMNFMHQLGVCMCGFLILPGIELVSCLLKNTVSATAAVIENALLDYQDELSADQNVRIIGGKDWQFTNIVIKISDFDSFVTSFTQLYYWKFFLQPILLITAVTIHIYLYMADLGSDIGGAACCYIQLLILSDIGQIVNDANKLIVDSLNQFPHYLLPVKQQRTFQLILKRMQHGAKIQMGPFTELNYESASDQTKMIYSYVMLLQRATV